MANPDAAIDYVKARDGIINVDLEKRRLRMAIDAVVASPDARAEGFGQVVPGRMALMASQVSDASTCRCSRGSSLPSWGPQAAASPHS
jgi:NitT/TauT family transport system substrate-binding protein